MSRLKLPYATTVQLAAAVVQEREIAYDTTLDRVVMGDGADASGKPLAFLDEVEAGDAAMDARVDALEAKQTSSAMTPVVQAATLELGRSAFGLGTEDEVEFAKLYAGDPDEFVVDTELKFQVTANTGATAVGFPDGPPDAALIAIKTKGDGATVKGGTALRLVAADRGDVTGNSNAGVLYPLRIEVSPAVARPASHSPYNDAAGIVIQNISGVSGAYATDAIWIANSPLVGATSKAFTTIFNTLANCDVALNIGGYVGDYGLDMAGADLVTDGAIRLQAEGWIRSYNPGNPDIDVVRVNSSDEIEIGSGTTPVKIRGSTALAHDNAFASAAEARAVASTTKALTPSSVASLGLPILLFELLNADLNSTSDQAFTKRFSGTTFIIQAIKASWVSGANPVSTAQGGIYTATAKGGSAIVAATQGYGNNQGTGTGTAITAVATFGNGERSDAALYLSLTTPQGAAAVANVRIWGYALN